MIRFFEYDYHYYHMKTQWCLRTWCWRTSVDHVDSSPREKGTEMAMETVQSAAWATMFKAEQTSRFPEKIEKEYGQHKISTFQISSLPKMLYSHTKKNKINTSIHCTHVGWRTCYSLSRYFPDTPCRYKRTPGRLTLASRWGGRCWGAPVWHWNDVWSLWEGWGALGCWDTLCPSGVHPVWTHRMARGSCRFLGTHNPHAHSSPSR